MKEKVLDVHNLTIHLQVGGTAYPVVDDLSFSLKKGKTLAIVGESGCGKTLTALSLLRILPPAALAPRGEVLFAGKNLLTLKEKELRQVRGSRIAMIFQDPASALNPVYTVGDQLLETVSLHLGLDDEEGRRRVIEAFQEVGIPLPEERLDEYPHQLSGGLKQRVMIAMMLVCQPDVLIADEPTTALDVTIQAQVLELIRKLQEKNGMSLLLITHDMGVVAEMADDVIVMYASQGVEKGNVYDIFDRMAHPYTKGLFDSMPNSRNHRGKLLPIKGSVPPLDKYPEGCHFHPRCPYMMEKCKKDSIPGFSIAGSQEHASHCLLHDGSVESRDKLIQIGGFHAATPP